MIRTHNESPPGVVPVEYVEEWLKCSESPAYFIDNYARIYDPDIKDWLPFRIWRSQYTTLQTVYTERLVIVLKARQMGLTWLILAFVLWLCIFRPKQTALLFSRRDTEAIYLLSDERLMGMYRRLPPWLQPGVDSESQHSVTFSNGSTLKAFPTTAGDSYTATVVMVDEADLVPDLNRLMRSVKPTIDAGGRMILISRSDKTKPNSEFKNIFRAARLGENGWSAVFLPWNARPDRDNDWYEAQRRDVLSRTGAIDDLYEQYPANENQALSARSQDKRIPAEWLERCFVEQSPIAIVGVYGETPDMPSYPGLTVYSLPEPGEKYVIGGDPAEGNPTSDDSAMTVLSVTTGDEVASYHGKIQPAIFAALLDKVAEWYNGAGILPERNNHGHAVILWLNDNSRQHVLHGIDKKPGWLSSSKGKVLMYDHLAQALNNDEITIHSLTTKYQVASIEGSTLRAPEGDMDDMADSLALAVTAMSLGERWQEIEFLAV